jgi:hypothetical protein
VVSCDSIVTVPQSVVRRRIAYLFSSQENALSVPTLTLSMTLFIVASLAL